MNIFLARRQRGFRRRLAILFVLASMGILAKSIDEPHSTVVSRCINICSRPFTLHGGANARRNADGTLDVITQKTVRHNSQIIFDLKDIDCSLVTHFSFEIELLSDYGTELETYLTSDRNHKLWHGMGTPGKKNAILRGYKQLFGFFPQKGEKLSRLLIGTTRAPHGQTFRIRKLTLEFRPETIRRQTQASLDILKRQNLEGNSLKYAHKLQHIMDRAYGKATGNAVAHWDAQHFLQIADKVKYDARMKLREVANKIAFAATGLDYGVGVADSMDQVFLTGFGTELTYGSYALELARNEYESFQAVVIAGERKLTDVSVTIGPFSGPGGNVLRSRSAVVGYSKSAPPPRAYLCETTGYYPEIILLNQKKANVQPHESVPFWMTVHAPAGTQPGIYKATVTVKVAGSPSYAFPLTVRVFDFTLPNGTSIPTCFHFNARDYQKIYKFKTTAESHRFEEKMVDFAASYRVIYDKIYSWRFPDNDLRPYFERMKRLNDKGLLSHFCLFNLYYPGKNLKVDRSITDPNHPEVDVVIKRNAEVLKKNIPILKEMGLLNKAYIYGYDEDYPNAVIARICNAIKRDYPEIPIMTTMRFGNPKHEHVKDIDIWVPVAQIYACNPGLIDNFRRAGKRVYWYVCDLPRPPQPTFMLEVPGAVPRLFMGMMTQKYKPDGFLYWSAHYWRKMDVTVSQGPRTNWIARTCHTDSAEGALFYPGENQTILPGLRTENYRDGIEDHWYYKLLEKNLEQGRGTPAARQNAQRLLEIPDGIVHNTGVYSTDSRLIREQRHKVAQALEALQK